MKIFTTFSGIGGWETGFKRIFSNLEIVGYSEIDKFVIKAYKQTHKIINNDAQKNYGDITKIDPTILPNFDLYCSSPPCQAFSVAGKGQGKDDKKGRGRLFENSINIMRIKQPKITIYENVKGLIGKKHKKYFEYLLKLMEESGYKVYWKILNTKEYGIPQNRERVFIICIRNDIQKEFNFPKKEKLKLFVKDLLDDEVNEKYYISEEKIKKLIDSGFKEKNISNTITSSERDSLNNKHIFDTISIGNVNPSGKGINGNIYTGNISPTLTTNKGEGIKFLIPFNNKRLLKILQNPVNKSHLTYELTGDTPSGISRQSDRIYDINKYSPCLNCTQKEILFSKKNNLNIRKLIPRECFRLQGYNDDEYNIKGISNSQQYKIVGNGLSINVIEKLARECYGILND